MDPATWNSNNVKNYQLKIWMANESMAAEYGKWMTAAEKKV